MSIRHLLLALAVFTSAPMSSMAQQPTDQQQNVENPVQAGDNTSTNPETNSTKPKDGKVTYQTLLETLGDSPEEAAKKAEEVKKQAAEAERKKKGLVDPDFDPKVPRPQIKTPPENPKRLQLYRRIYANLYTSFGKIRLQLYHRRVPNTVGNFVDLVEGRKEFTEDAELVKRPFYKDHIFRVFRNFMIQTGDPTGTGYGGPGYTQTDEIRTDLRHRPGTVSMGKTSKGTHGSQFFILVSQQKHLDGNYTIFGEVAEGMNIVESISRQPASRNGVPRKKILLYGIDIDRVD